MSEPSAMGRGSGLPELATRIWWRNGDPVTPRVAWQHRRQPGRPCVPGSGGNASAGEKAGIWWRNGDPVRSVSSGSTGGNQVAILS